MKENLNSEDAEGDASPTFLQPEEIAGSSRQQEVANSCLLPNRADQLIAFATGIGYKAYRNTEKGSWYIEVLTEVLRDEYCSKKSKKRARRHLVDVLTEVQGRISNFVTKEVDRNNAVMMPEFNCKLRGPLYLCTDSNRNRNRHVAHVSCRSCLGR